MGDINYKYFGSPLYMFHSYDFSNNAMQLLSPWIFYSFMVFVLIFHLFLIQKDCENMLLCGFVCMSVLVLYCVSSLYVCGGVILAFIFLQPIENNSFRDASCLSQSSHPTLCCLIQVKLYHHSRVIVHAQNPLLTDNNTSLHFQTKYL